MIIRLLNKILQNDLQKVPVIGLLGPRQAGKTTLVKQLAALWPGRFLYLDLESPADKAKLQDPEYFLSTVEAESVVLDEIQLMPELFPVLRSLVDKDRRPGRFLLLGSASQELLRQSSESLAGRIRYRELYPLNILEAGGELNQLWFRGGFPLAFMADSDEDAMQWMTDFIFTYYTRDLVQLGMPMPSAQVLRLLQMLAHMHGQVVNYSNLAKSLEVSVPTIQTAMYYLEEALLIRRLKPWFSNSKKRLVKSPKVYFRDSGMLHNLLFLDNYGQLLGHPQAGNSWEGFVIQQIISVLDRKYEVYFYRTQDGAEADLIIVQGNAVKWQVEIKLSNQPVLTRGNTESRLFLKPEKCMIITPSSDDFRINFQWEARSVESAVRYFSGI